MENKKNSNLSESQQLLLMIRNTKAKLLLEETLMQYSKSILVDLEYHPELLSDLLEYFNMGQDEFFEKINSYNENITFYDAALLRMRKNKDKNK